MRTKNCMNCGKPAVTWTGHVHTEIGEIISGWCEDHRRLNHSSRPRVTSCKSINPYSCGGYFNMDEIELREELTPDNLIRHARSMEFSRQVDEALCCSNAHENEGSYVKSILIPILDAFIIASIVAGLLLIFRNILS